MSRADHAGEWAVEPRQPSRLLTGVQVEPDTTRRKDSTLRYWLGVASKDHVALGVADGFCHLSCSRRFRSTCCRTASSTGWRQRLAGRSRRSTGSLGEGAGDGVGHEAASQSEDCPASQGRTGVKQSIGYETGHDGYQVRRSGSGNIRPV